MAFHAGAHKAKPPNRNFRFRMKHRVLVAAIGASFILGGLHRFAHGDFSSVNRLHQPVYSTDAIGIGAAIAVCALIPSSWLARSAKLPKSKSVGKNRHSYRRRISRSKPLVHFQFLGLRALRPLKHRGVSEFAALNMRLRLSRIRRMAGCPAWR